MENFKQNPEGFRTRSLIEEMIKTYGKQMTIPFVANLKDDKITIGGYVFRRPSFRSLIQYIWVGGMPRWKDEIRPPYVMMMKKKIEASENSLFEGLLLS
jgi:hypothetical protein